MKQQLLLIFILLTALGFSQNIIKGTISDIDGTLPFANVIIKDTFQGVTADENGFFLIDAKSTDVLEVSYLGYENKTIEVGNKKTIDIVLDDYEELNEVIVFGVTKNILCTTTISCGRSGCGFTKIEYKMALEKDSKAISLYPNPSKDGIFYIKSAEEVSEVTIVVSDISGRLLSEFKKNNFNSSLIVDLSNQPSGIYIISLFSNGKLSTSKKAIRL